MSDLVERLREANNGTWVNIRYSHALHAEAADRITQLETALARARENEWKPMSDAPKDGTPIEAVMRVYRAGTKELLYWARDIVWYHDEFDEIHPDCERGWEWESYEFFRDLSPLPSAP